MTSLRDAIGFRRKLPAVSLLALACFVAADPLHGQQTGVPWNRHTIDDASRGADGVRLADANGDGLPDIATGWEEGGLIRVYLNPGHQRAGGKWPAVTVGKVGDPEDAVFVDLDADGALDVVSCCEGHVKSVFVHWAPRDKADYLDSAAWRSEAFPGLEGEQLFMFCLPLQIDGRHGMDLVLGSKGRDAQISWLQSPENPRDLAAWKWHALHDARWVMSLAANDVDGDGDADIVASDREGARRGCLWLENPDAGPAQTEPWVARAIGPVGEEITFLDVVDFDRDGRLDVVAPSFERKLWFHRRTAARLPAWESRTLPYPEPVAFARSVRGVDVDLDGKMDVVLTSRSPEGKTGAVWMSQPTSGGDDAAWKVHDISGPAGPKGLKLDIIQLVDLDGDADLDLITTEEHTGLGVIWYENPTRR